MHIKSANGVNSLNVHCDTRSIIESRQMGRMFYLTHLSTSLAAPSKIVESGLSGKNGRLFCDKTFIGIRTLLFIDVE